MLFSAFLFIQLSVLPAVREKRIRRRGLTRPLFLFLAPGAVVAGALKNRRVLRERREGTMGPVALILSVQEI